MRKIAGHSVQAYMQQATKNITSLFRNAKANANCFEWVRNLICHTDEGTQAEGCLRTGCRGKTWASERWGTTTLYNAGLQDLYSSPNIVIKKEITRHVARMVKWTGAYWILVRKSEGKRPL
jgi:hypothetical protein